MILSRRQTIKLLATAAPALRGLASFAAQSQGITVTPGPFAGTRRSLQSYTVPAWFNKAKFGIWSHWGPQSAVGDGDWYARKMYMQGSQQYEYHVKRFGHPSKVGYKDTIPVFTADKWDPDHLMDLYVRAGAKYFFSMGVHHDNFDMWHSRFHPHWNAVDSGPKKDIVGTWAKAARKRGLPFGVSEHLSNSYDWFATSHTADKTGPLAGIPYDGADPKFSSLYHDYAGEPANFIQHAQPMGLIAPERWKREYYRRIKDLVDQHKPDLLYTDGGIPFDEYGLALVAEEYNMSARGHDGKIEAVYNSKTEADCAMGTCVLDRERGVSDDIWPSPWQTDTCIGDWHYKEGLEYKSAKKVIDLLVDIVSKNGNLLLNFPLPASGELDSGELKVLQGITDWMSVNSGGIYDSQPWSVYGEGPATKVLVGDTRFNESVKPDLTAEDVRFTRKDKSVFAFMMGWPGSEASVRSLGSAAPTKPGKVANVRMLGRDEDLRFSQKDAALQIKMPDARPAVADIGITFKVEFA